MLGTIIGDFTDLLKQRDAQEGGIAQSLPSTYRLVCSIIRCATRWTTLRRSIEAEKDRCCAKSAGCNVGF
jgi:hypothetical protein